MPKNLSIIDLKPRNTLVFDTKPKNSFVSDTKPRNSRLGEIDDVAIYLSKGMSVGPGWFQYVTYPQTTIVYP